MKGFMRTAGAVQSLPVRCQQQLNAYGLAAAAAGVSILALAQPSEAKIIYTPTHRVIGDRGYYGIDFSGQGRTALTIQNQYHTFTTTRGTFHTESLAASMAGSNQVVDIDFGAAALKQGMQIGPRRAFHGGAVAMAILNGGSRTSDAYGSWINVKNRYLGVKFQIKGKTHYGWARLSVKVRLPLTIKATLTGYAYETIPNKPIITGKTKGPDVITLEPGSLGVLAAGRK